MGGGRWLLGACGELLGAIRKCDAFVTLTMELAPSGTGVGAVELQRTPCCHAPSEKLFQQLFDLAL